MLICSIPIHPNQRNVFFVLINQTFLFLTMKTFRYYILCCFLLFANFGGREAWCSTFKASQSNYMFRHLTSSDGLSCNHVECILKDSRGYMWFGTEYGLNRFDGYRFKHFFKKDIPYSSDNISSLQEDSWGNIWIYMGVFTVYDWKTDSFIEGKQFYAKIYSMYLSTTRNVYGLRQTTSFMLLNTTNHTRPIRFLLLRESGN